MKVHFIGIGGIGISALAQYYLAKGAEVFGSDLASSEIIEILKQKGIRVSIGQHKAENISRDLDLVIFSPAVQESNSEFIQAKKYGIEVLSYPQALGRLTKDYFTIAVSGSHGKSTTTAMISLILVKAGLNPIVILGTKLKEFGDSNFRMGGNPKIINDQLSIFNDQFLVIEADEYRASFLNYWPKIIILTNIEEEHLDYYKNLKNLLKTFKEFIRHLPKEGVLIANRDDKNIRRILYSEFKIGNSKLVQNSKFKIRNYFLEQEEAKELKKILKVPGEHNIYNALAALACARVLGISDQVAFEALSDYKGAWRRFETKEIIIDHLSSILVSDYAHHPTEIRATLQAAREKWPNKKIWVVFQPHQYQRTYYFFERLVKVFAGAEVDKIILTPIYDVAGREQREITEKVSSPKLAEAIRAKARGKEDNILYFPDFGTTKSFLEQNIQGGEIVMIMGAGDIYRLAKMFST